MKTIRNEVLMSEAVKQNPELVKRVLDRVRECFQIGNSKLPDIHCAPDPHKMVVFFEKSRLGGYVWEKYGTKVFLNWPLLLNNEESYMTDTIPHEVCHLFANAILKKSGRRETSHGPVWKKTMRSVFGLAPIRCHQMDTSTARRDKETVRYICTCMKHDLSKIVHNRIKNGRNYRCRRCGSILTQLNPS